MTYSNGTEMMQDYGLVSIIMPTYNCAAYICTAIRSVQVQTYPYWELIIQDDCSTDCTYEMVKSLLDDTRIRYYRNERNSGAAVSRNNALRQAKGRWMAFLDSDDMWMPEKLEKQLEFMMHGHYAFSYTCYEEMDEKGCDTNIRISGPAHISPIGMYSYCWPGCLTVMYDKDSVGLIQIEDIKKNNDYAIWLKVIEKADCYLLHECLAKYRRGRCGSISSNGYVSLIRWHYRLFRKSIKMNVWRAASLTVVNVICGAYKKLIYVRRVN